MKVKVYLLSNAEVEFPARNERIAQEMAKRIITEGCWIKEGKIMEYYPVHQIFKVKIKP